MRVGLFAFKRKIQLVTEKKEQCSQRRLRRCRGEKNVADLTGGAVGEAGLIVSS